MIDTSCRTQATFPKRGWDQEVEQGFKFYIDSGRTDLEEPTHFETVRYFRDRAPEEVAIPDVPSEPTTHTFEKITPLDSAVTCTRISNGMNRRAAC